NTVRDETDLTAQCNLFLFTKQFGKIQSALFCHIFSAFVVIICSNSTIVWLIWFHKNLHEPMYFFIAALLLNSILFSSAIYPKILLDILSEKQVVTYSTCLFQWYILYAIAGAEFWLLMFMALDRYLAICKPLQYPTIMTKSRVNVLLTVAWTVPASQFIITISAASQRKICHFVTRGIICNTFAPVIFNCFTYIHIFITANRRGLEVRKKAMSTCLPHLVVLFNYFCLCSFDVLLARVEEEFPQLGRFIMSVQLILYHPLFNPFIYGLKMKKISTHLQRIFWSKYYCLFI
uniref:G-protein coupled receptors family 1 profile domain-containing protein n=1 Tax=Neogobius melanostomus TaxID=47308 RepID=A0A8C6SBM1_9GOBI